MNEAGNQKSRAATISAKLLFSFATVLALVMGLSYSSLSAIGSLGAALDRAIHADAKKLQYVNEIQTSFQEMRADSTKVEISLVNMLIVRLNAPGGASAEATCASCHTPDTVIRQKQRLEAATGALKEKIVELRPLIHSGNEREALEKIASGVTEWQRLYGQYMDFAAKSDFTHAHGVMLDQIYPLIDSLEKSAKVLANEQQDMLSDASQEAHSRVATSRAVAFVLLGLCLAAGFAVFRIVRGVNRSLRQFAGEMRQVTERVAGAAAQVSSSSQALARGATEQAASIEETSASAEEINIMAHRSAEGSQMASTNMEEAAKRVGEANATLQQMMDSMDAINASSGKISKIIKVIDEIAFQTNILALNAAVEAARAGEAGMGFAVVADEVRNLAQRCAEAARDTSGLIEESIAMSQEGRGKFDQVQRAIRSMTESAEQVRTLVDSVSGSSQEQQRGVEQVARAITQMEKVTQANAASAEQNAAAGHELNAQSESLRNMVEKLVALV